MAALLATCAGDQTLNLGQEIDGCRPSLMASDPIHPGELRASSDTAIEAWALIFQTWETREAQELLLPAEREVKIVWRSTGSGEADLSARDASGLEIEPDWGPQPHLSSNWSRPGEEWGTGWTFPSEGCWTITIERGQSQAWLVALVQDQSRFNFPIPEAGGSN